jgi:hypothetical protein
MASIIRGVLCAVVGLAACTLAHAEPAPRCVALPLPTLRGADSSATELASGLRDLVSGFLKGPSLRTVLLEARLPDQALEEAREQRCATVLTLTLTRKKAGGGGLGRAFGSAAGAAAWQLPYGGSTAKSTVIRGVAIAGAAAVSTAASNTRAKDEVQMEYRLASDNGSVVRQGKDGAKASADGEDLITPLVERVAGVVAAAMPR